MFLNFHNFKFLRDFFHISHFLSYDSVVSTTRYEDDLSCFDYREFCIFDTNRIKIIGLIEFGVVPDPNFLYPPVKVYDNHEKVGVDVIVWDI